ncbi:MAG: efflux RND transporter periplasmic adaptor subunit, partial [Xanthomonadales bacterium]|nr:efflux RND transporter periplasmic adaptor subunit [Xanthomonadales bacterium]
LAFDVSGLVKSVEVSSGADVKQGQVLITVVDADDRAKLAALQAMEKLAALTAKRSQKQYAVKAVSRAQYDTDLANLKIAQANVTAQAALVAKKTLRAPFAGRIGIITANAGQYIKAGDPIVTLQQLDNVFVDFTLPQSALNRLHVGSAVTLTADAYADKTFTGKISATDPKINAATRNLGVEASVPNPDKLLVPGMFTKVAVANGAAQRYLTLPQTAVTYAPYGDTVFVVHDGTPPTTDDSGKPVPAKTVDGAHTSGKTQRYVKQVLVTLGPKRGDQVAILKGIDEGDVVVTSGGMKLKNGTPVNINNKVKPAFDPNPQPTEE